MAVKIVLTNSSQITGDLASDRSKLKMSRAIYQRLGSLVKNKTISGDYDNDKLPLEYKQFLDDLNDLYMFKNYPKLIPDDFTLKSYIEDLDEYLGSLGLDEEYSYTKDTVDIPIWINTSDVSEVRVLTDTTDNTYLTDTNGDILVAYKGE